MSKREIEREFREWFSVAKASPLFPKKNGRERDDLKRFLTKSVLEEALARRAA